MIPFKYSLIPYTNTTAGEEIIFSPAIVVKKMCNYIHNGKKTTNFAGIKYFLAMSGGSANGIYKVSKMSFVMIDGQPRLQLGLSEFAEFCETPKSIYGKMRPGEIITTNQCLALFAD